MKKFNETDQEVIELLVNKKQGKFLTDVTSHHYKMVGMIGARGSGKSVSLADIFQIGLSDLPRGKCGWSVTTIKYGKAMLTPNLQSAWKRWGCHEYNYQTGEGDYVLYQKPPASFKLPYDLPCNWKNCITFANGFCIELQNVKRATTKIGTYDMYVVNDGALFKKAWLKLVIPSIRANYGKFNSFLHHTLFAFSSPPWTSDGQWIYEIEELARSHPDDYYFMEVKTSDNQIFLPPDYVAHLKKELTNLEFEVDVKCKRTLINGESDNQELVDINESDESAKVIFNTKTRTVYEEV